MTNLSIFEMRKCEMCQTHTIAWKIIEVCHKCRKKIETDMLKHRPKCRWFWFDDDAGRWRAHRTRKDGTIHIFEAVTIEAQRRQGKPWTLDYLIERQQTDRDSAEGRW